MRHVSETHLPISSYSTTTPLFLLPLLQTPYFSPSLPSNPKYAPATTRFGFQHSSPTTMNKQRIGKRVPFYWDADDIAVGEILIELLDLIPSHDYSKPSFAWGAKRRRSQPQPQPPSSVAIETKSNVGVVAATSPATPLMFSPSESDDNNKTSTPNSHVSVPKTKRKLQNKEELMQSFTDLTRQKDSLVKESEVVKRHLDILRASNLELRHRKQAIIYGLSPPAHQALHQQQQQLLHYPFQLQHPSMQWSTSSVRPAVNKVAPVGLPDLNLTLEEVAAASAGNVEGGYQGSSSDVMMVMDYNVNNNRALASAQARKRRKQIYKEKSQNQILRQR